MLSPVLDADFDDLAEPPRYWCDECRAHRLFYYGDRGLPICRVCLPKEQPCLTSK